MKKNSIVERRYKRDLTRKEKRVLKKIDRVFNKLFKKEMKDDCTCTPNKDLPRTLDCPSCWKYGCMKYSCMTFIMENNLEPVFHAHVKLLSKSERKFFRLYIFVEDLKQLGLAVPLITVLTEEMYKIRDKEDTSWYGKKTRKRTSN